MFQDIIHYEDLDAGLEYMQRMLADDIQTYSMKKRYIRREDDSVWANLK